MRNTIILSAVLLIAVITASIYYFKNLDNHSTHATRHLRLLPENTLLIASIDNSDNPSNSFKNFEILDALIGFDDAEQWSNLKTNILQNPAFQTYVSGTELFISFHPDQKNIAPLFTIPITSDLNKNNLATALNSISKKYKTSSLDTLGHRIHQIHYGEKDSLVNTLFYAENIFVSPSLPLLLTLVDKHTKHLSSEQLNFFLEDHPRISPLSVYFPHQQYDSILNITQQNPNGPFLNLFKKLHGQSAFNINFKKDALILSGESQLDQYPENYASIFQNQEKKRQYLYEYFPSNTAIYAEFGVSNPSTFRKDLHQLFKRREEKIIATLDTSKTVDLLYQALGNQFALVETNAQNTLGFIEISDSTAFKQLREQFIESSTDSISRLKVSNLLYQRYGDVFKELPRPYCTIIDSILVVANHLPSLRNYRQDYLNNDVLVGTLGYIKLSQIQSKEANITLFAHTRNANNKFISSLNQPFKDNFRNKDKFGYQDFFAWSLQLSGNPKGNMSSQIFATYKSENTLGGKPEWNYALKNKAITKPYVFDQSDTSQFIMIQELDHTIHAINPAGEKIWSKVFAGRVVGDIQQLDDKTIVFMTDKNNLYRIDVDGRPIDGFPKNIGSSAVGTLLITNIKGQNTLLIPTTNTIVAYDLGGKERQNWNRLSLEGNLSTAILQIDQNYVVGTSSGHIYWLNEIGQKVDTQTLNHKVIGIHALTGYKLVALDDKGEIHFISSNQATKNWSLRVDSNRYVASFIDPNGSNSPNLAIINKNKLEVFTLKDSLQVVFDQVFTKSLDQEIQSFTGKNKSPLLGVASKATNLIYVIEETGQLIDGFPIEGQPLFYYGPISNNASTYVLCMRRDNKLYAFSQQN